MSGNEKWFFKVWALKHTWEGPDTKIILIVIELINSLLVEKGSLIG